MIYYLYNLEWKNYKKKSSEHYRIDRDSDLEVEYGSSLISNLNDEYCIKYEKERKFLINITNRTDRYIEIQAALDIECASTSECDDYISEHFRDFVLGRKKEITALEFRREIDAGRFGHSTKVIRLLGLDYRCSMFDPFPFDMDEQVSDGSRLTRAACLKQASSIMASKSMTEELKRIYSSKNIKKYYGHPVHYFVSAGDRGAAMDICNLLISALRSNNRLISGRQVIISDIKKGCYRDERYRQVLNAAEGGTVILELRGQDDMGIFASDFHELTKVTGDILSKQKKDTLFIFVEITGKSFKDSDALNSITSKADIIQITEGSGTYEQAKDYLMSLVDKTDFAKADKSDALEYLPKNESFTVTDIYSAYNAWYGSGLKTHIYKAYSTKTTYKVEVKKIESRPYEELMKLVGLKDIKAVIDDIIAAGKMKCVRERMGLKTDNTSMHMIFTGNPGTAKTTAARLIAGILRDEDVIKSGKFVECGRQDLIAKYVGWTAKTVAAKFREAEGGILFIDEAYALVDDSNSYGAEAINTITQLMENYRDRVIVIFAGYPDKMKEFLDQNEGLRSRISFHLDFPDYSSTELLDIMKIMSSDLEYRIDETAMDKCLRIFDKACRIENFGNGRYVRNVLEHAVLHQSGRIIAGARGSSEELTREKLSLLLPEDFEFIPVDSSDNKMKIGFV